jgi:DNA-binding NarL/FixJ family response regulator
MQPLNVVLLQSDPGTVQSLIAPLGSCFRSVREARSLGDVRDSVAQHNAKIVILDIEMTSLTDVEKLCHDFPEACIVCTHRLADEEMWTEVLSAGAADCCVSSDPRSIVEAACRYGNCAASIAA